MKSIPNTNEIYSQLVMAIKNKLGIPQNEDLKDNIDILASVMSAQFKLAYLFLSDIQRNALPDLADSFENGGDLNRHGMLYLGRLPFPASDGKYKVKVTGIDGSIIKSGITLKSNDDAKSPGKMFINDIDYTLTGTDGEIEIRSLESGLESLLKVGDFLTFSEPIIGVDFDAEVISVVTSPTSAETTEEYRNAILEAIQIEPYGGAKGDYILWGKDAKGVRNIFPYVKQNEPGTVQIYVEATKGNSTDGLGTPPASMLSEVMQVIIYDPDETKPMYERSRLPIQVTPEVLPISLRPVDIEVNGLQDISGSIGSVLRENLEKAIADIRPFIDGATLERNRNDIISIGNIQSTILNTLSANNYFSNVTIAVDGNIVQTFMFSRANIPYLRYLKINGNNV